MPEETYQYTVVGVLSLLVGTALFVYGIFTRPATDIYKEDPFHRPSFSSSTNSHKSYDERKAEEAELDKKIAYEESKKPLFYIFVVSGIGMSFLGLVLIGYGKKPNPAENMQAHPDDIAQVEQLNFNEHTEIIKIRCQNCKSLNEEDAKFCKECGHKI
jgi:hypothetical protein